MNDAELHADEAHPGYEYAMTIGPRTAERRPMSDPGEPPWERNTHRGEDGWERFDDHWDKAYWMRQKPRVSRGLAPDPTACEEQLDVYRERAQLLANRVAELNERVEELELKCVSWSDVNLKQERDLIVQRQRADSLIAELRSALRALIAAVSARYVERCLSRFLPRWQQARHHMHRGRQLHE